MKPQLPRVAVAAVLGIAIAGAQTAHVYHHVPPTGQITNTVLCNFSCSNPPEPPVPQQAVAPGYVTAALTPAPSTPFSPLGGHALDQRNNREYVSDGLSITIHQFHPLYDGSKLCTAAGLCAAGGLIFGPGQIGPLGFFRPPLLGGGTFGNVTGMAVRQGNFLCPGRLYVTDGAWVMGLTLCPDTAGGWTAAGVVEGPWPAPLPLTSPLSGLEFDFLTGWIVGCDSGGTTWIFPTPLCSMPIPGIGFLTFPPPPTMPGGALIIGNVFDRSLSGIGIYVTDGASLFPVMSPCGLVPAIPVGIPAPGQISRGASFSAEPIVLQASPGVYSPLVIGTNEPAVAGKTNFTITLQAGPALANLPAALLYGPCTSVNWFSDCTGSRLWIDPNQLNFVYAATDSVGDICLDVGTVPYVGLTVYVQWLVLDYTCPLPPHGKLSDALHLRISDA